MSLYKVILKGFLCNGIKESMVVSTDPTSAYKKVRDWLDKNSCGYPHDRQFHLMQLMAEDINNFPYKESNDKEQRTAGA